MDSTAWGTIAAFGMLTLMCIGAFGTMMARSISRLERSQEAGAKLSAEAITLLGATINASASHMDKVFQDETGRLREEARLRLASLEAINLRWTDIVLKHAKQISYGDGYRDAQRDEDRRVR